VTEKTAASPGHDFVRPFIMTKGRTRVERTDLRFETLVQSVGGPVPTTVPTEQVAILKLAVRPISVAEIAADLHLVVGVVNVLINDLLEDDLLEVHSTEADDIELDMLDRIAQKIRSL
jgi:hypothetical protein